MAVDGVRIRAAEASDEARVAGMARALSRESLRRRFMGGIATDVATSELVRETRGGPHEVALVAEYGSAVVGEAYAASIGEGCAEAAFIVAEGYRHEGVGTRLFAALVQRLKALGLRRMRVETLADNREMLALITECGLPYTLKRIDGSVVATLQLAR